jgi:hypothetical protein
VGFFIGFSKIFAVVALGSICGAVAIPGAIAGEGRYQRTKDGKTLVWNDNAKPGDVATWSGDRDREGYASGFGTLNWYTARKAEGSRQSHVLYAYYFGNMVRGKFNGPVNAHASGLTSHAMFADGRRSTRWAAGPTASWTMRPKSPAPAPLQIAATRATGPKRESVTTSLQASATLTADRPRPNFDAVHQAPSAGADVAPVEPPAEGPKAPVPQPPAANVEPTPAANPPAIPPANGDAPQPPPDTAQAAAPSPHNEESTEAREAESLQSLAAPPSLRSGDDQANENDETSAARATSAQLSEQQVINLADSEARKHGYDPAQFRRSQPQFDPVDGTWSLTYEPAPADQSSTPQKHFSVAIHDQTKRSAIVTGR